VDHRLAGGDQFVHLVTRQRETIADRKKPRPHFELVEIGQIDAQHAPGYIIAWVTAVAALFAIGCGGWLVVWGFGGIAQWVIANAARLQGLYMYAADLLEQRGLYAAELFAQQINVLWLVQVLRAISGSLQGILSFCIVTFVFVVLGLLEVEPLGRRLRQVGSEDAIDTAGEIAARLQTYMLVRFGMSVLTGLAFWAFTAVDGLELQTGMGGDRLRPKLHTLHRLFRCDAVADAVRGRPV
jgi:predicted PurR-regulated permease PerM